MQQNTFDLIAKMIEILLKRQIFVLLPTFGNEIIQISLLLEHSDAIVIKYCF